MDLTSVAVRLLDIYATGGIMIAGLVALWGIKQGVSMFKSASYEDDLLLEYDDYAFYSHLDNLNNDRVEIDNSDLLYSFEVPYYGFSDPLVDGVYLYAEENYVFDEYGFSIDSEWVDSDYESPSEVPYYIVADEFGLEVESKWI